MKKSATGLLRVEKEGDKFVLYDKQSIAEEREGALETVFVDGFLLRDKSFATIVERLKQ
jgi:nicotinamide phosphoribosyltransferase